MAKTPIKQTETPKRAFEISEDIPPPVRTRGANDDYGLIETFAQMKAGQNILVRFSDVPLNVTRALVQRFGRNGGPKDAKGKGTAVKMITATVKEGDKEIGLRIWRNS